MPKPLQGAEDWAPARSATGSRPADTIERVIERRIPASTPPETPPPRSDPPRPDPPLYAFPTAAFTPGTPAYLFAANRTLSGSALKVLLAVLEAGDGATLLRNDFKRLTGLSGDHAILNAVQECVDNEWLLRRYQCRWCLAPVVSSYDTIRLTECRACGRKMTPQAVFCLMVPDGVPNEHGGMPIEHGGMSKQHTPVSNEHTSMLYKHTGVSNEHTEGMPLQHTGMPIEQTGVLNGHTLPQPSDAETGVPNEHTRQRGNEMASSGSALRAKAEGMLKKHTGMSLEHTQGVSKEQTGMSNGHTSHTRADSDSVARIKSLDSRIPDKPGSGEAGRLVYASGEWQQMTEKLARDSAKRIGDKSVGFHVKVWAHARKLDWEQGGRRCEEGLFAIAQELEGKQRASGRGQGALWTKMVRKYFEERGSPLLTEAETAEWKELHSNYAPPSI